MFLIGNRDDGIIVSLLVVRLGVVDEGSCCGGCVGVIGDTKGGCAHQVM